MPTNTPQSFAPWLKERRKELGLTQEELADLVGCARSTIRKLEAGTRRPSKALAEELARALQIPREQQAHFAQLARITGEKLPASPVGESPGSPAPLYRVPASLTSLIGRDEDVAAVQARLLQPGVRLLTIIGPPGIGKTRLSQKVAASMRAHFAHGVVFVALATLEDPALVLPTMARALGLDESGNRPVKESLHHYLQSRQILLVLDNFEQVVEAAPQLSELLADAAELKLLVTSRRPLRLYAEHKYVVPALTIPDLRALPSVDELAQIPAVALFLERSQAVAPDFSLTTQNAPVVAEVCVRLDGLPLALELAAARTELYSVSVLRDQLADPARKFSLRLLERESQDITPRQQTMAGAIAWSYQLLHEANRAFFRRLAVFVGGFTREAAAAVCGAGDTYDRLASLLDKSLLQAISPSSRLPSLREEEPRFSMLHVIRQFAWQQLEESGEADALRQRHLEYYLRLAQTAYPNLEGAQTGLWLDRLEEEHDNFRAALVWGLAGNAVEVAGELLNMLWWFWHVRGYYSEGRHWLSLALAPAQATQMPSKLYAHLLNAAAVLSWNQGDYEQARPLLEQALDLHRAAGNSRGVAAILGNLGIVVRRLGDYTYALRCQQECLALCRQEGRPWYTAVALNNVGELYRDLGDIAQARAYWEECLALRRELGDRRGMASVLLNLGDAAFDVANYRRARELWEESRAYQEALGDRSALAQALGGLGDVARVEGDLATAFALYQESLRIYQEVGDREGLAFSLEAVAALAAGQQEFERATRLLGAAEALREVIGSRHSPADRVHYEKIVAAAGAGLAPQSLTAAWRQGRVLEVEQALELARMPIASPVLATGVESRALETLTAREQEVLRLLATGLSNKGIAETLFVSPATVQAHLRTIYDKLGVHSRSAATRFALEHNLA